MSDQVPGVPCGVCGKPTTGNWDGAAVYHAECLRKHFPNSTMTPRPVAPLPDHGNEIGWEEYCELTPLMRHCRKASEIVKGWPAWKRGILDESMKPQHAAPRSEWNREKNRRLAEYYGGKAE